MRQDGGLVGKLEQACCVLCHLQPPRASGRQTWKPPGCRAWLSIRTRRQADPPLGVRQAHASLPGRRGVFRGRLKFVTTGCLAHPDCRRSQSGRYTGRRSPSVLSSCDPGNLLRDFDQLSEYRRDSNSRDPGLGRLCTSLHPSQLSLSRQSAAAAAAAALYSSPHRQIARNRRRCTGLIRAAKCTSSSPTHPVVGRNKPYRLILLGSEARWPFKR
jgi:hypothetical protein